MTFSNPRIVFPYIRRKKGRKRDRKKEIPYNKILRLLIRRKQKLVRRDKVCKTVVTFITRLRRHFFSHYVVSLVDESIRISSYVIINYIIVFRDPNVFVGKGQAKYSISQLCQWIKQNKLTFL